MKWLILVGVLAIFVGLLLPLLKRKMEGAKDAGPWPFYTKKPLSPPEQVLYFRLVGALPDHIVLAQVQLSRFLGVKKGENFHQWNNRINRQSVDFLVCAKDATVLAAIELDDATHAKADRVQADAKKNKALSDAGVRIVRWQVKAMPDAEAIKATLLVQPAAATPPTAQAARAPRSAGHNSGTET